MHERLKVAGGEWEVAGRRVMEATEKLPITGSVLAPRKVVSARKRAGADRASEAATPKRQADQPQPPQKTEAATTRKPSLDPRNRRRQVEEQVGH